MSVLLAAEWRADGELIEIGYTRSTDINGARSSCGLRYAIYLELMITGSNTQSPSLRNQPRQPCSRLPSGPQKQSLPPQRRASPQMPQSILLCPPLCPRNLTLPLRTTVMLFPSEMARFNQRKRHRQPPLLLQQTPNNLQLQPAQTL